MKTPRKSTLEILDRLIAFDTTSRYSNLELIDWVVDFLAQRGVECQLLHDESGEKANLWATIGPKDVPGIMLSGHSDVVPVDGQDWSTDPFAMVERDGKLFGRGTADMKGFIAICLSHVDDFLAQDLKVPVNLAISYDEEVGCLGGRQLAEMLRGLDPKPRLCVVGEPTMMGVVTGHKGKVSYRARVKGFECHSSLTHQGVNAVEYAAELITAIRAISREKRDHGPYDEAFDPPYTSIHVGVVHGGTALNIVPKDCHFDFEFRNLPADDTQEIFGRIEAQAAKLTQEMQAIQPGTGISFEQISWFEGLETAEDAEATTLTKAFAQANASQKVSFGTEAGHYQGAGVPTVVCGPGDIGHAHKPDEFVGLEQIAAAEEFFARMIEWARRG
ncbi:MULTISPECIES: acetylornithine deacetylase [unclassified Minwuia]|jgi:acetylornithine deacetylase|uniref:acetylornithine deacetylase n=1 Tax=unclassified Minwuia TaxID=2618799 RepID=UPI00247AEA07|nr:MULTISPECIES: acetylornithine deacetylase [unclassified Minwuia]